MTSRRLTALAGTALLVGSGGASAQELGTQTNFSIASDIEYNDNLDLSQDERSGLIWNNIFSYGLFSRTTVDTFSFDARANARVIDGENQTTETDADDIQTGFAFARVVNDTRLSFDARYRRNRLDLFNPLEDLDNDGTFDDTAAAGLRESLRSGLDVALNTDGPISFLGSADYSRIRFSDVETTDPDDFDDRDRAEAAGELVFRVSPIVDLTTGVRYGEDIFESGDTDRRVLRGDVGTNLRINPRVTARARLGFSEVDTVRRGVEERETGAVGSVDFVIDQPLGETRFGTNVDLDENGQRFNVEVGRTLETDSTNLDADIGLSTSDETDVNVIGRVAFAYVQQRSEFGVSLRQTATVDDDGDNTINTFAGVSFVQNLTRRSSVSFGLNGGLRRNLDDDDDRTERADFTAQYNQSLTPDWSWNVGYRGRFERDDDDDARTSNAVFLGVRRDFFSTR